MKLSLFLITCLFLMIFLYSSILYAEASESETFTYDSNGNMISDSSFNYIYNDANQLAKITGKSDGKTIAEYYYDSSGKRAKKIENGVTTYYIEDYFETKILINNSENSSYYFANNERVARKNPNNTLRYYHNDHLGGTNLVTNGAGQQSEKVSYYPYGTIKNKIGDNDKYLFTGQEYDDESNLYYFDARYYNSNLARFIQPDIIIQDVYNPQNLNKYSYVLNNPTKYIDPTGHYIHEGGVITGSILLAGGLIVAAPVAGGVVVGTAAGALVGIAVLGGLGGAAIIMGSLIVPEEKASKWDESVTAFTGALNPIGLATEIFTAPFGKEATLNAIEYANLAWDVVSGGGERTIEKAHHAISVGWDMYQLLPKDVTRQNEKTITPTGTTTSTSTIPSTTTTTSTIPSTTTTTSTIPSTTTTASRNQNTIWDWLPRLFTGEILELGGR